MTERSLHADWLAQIEISGPFLAEPVLREAFPQGLDGLEAAKRKIFRQAYDEWREAIDVADEDMAAIHVAWIDLVLRQGLELDDVLTPAADLPNAIVHHVAEHDVTLRPDFVVVGADAESEPLCLIAAYAADVSLSEGLRNDRWAASPAERMVELCRAAGVRLGLVTNGEHWMLIDAPAGAVTSFATWHARLWGQEPVTLQAFINLLGVRRFFVDEQNQLPSLFDRSLEHQDEVTEALGEQVRRAVEVLIQTLDRADADRNRELLAGLEPRDIYEAALTVMMRIVFLLSAEERGLLLIGDERYEANYAVSTLRQQLRNDAPEILERRWDAWSRLLSVFRLVYGGVEHEAMRLPALGGSLFDPDRFAFLEGRAQGTHWKSDLASPLPIDNRTVLLLLDAVQLFQGRTLSYRALDVEQIGHVYEGLLERTVARAVEVTLDLDATKNAKNPWVTLPELDAAKAKGGTALADLLKDRTASAASRITNDLARAVDDASAEKLLMACQGDQPLRDHLKPYFHMIRMDKWGYPLVYPKNSFMVASGSDRREAGAHYTPKSLTEVIVRETLEPIVYVGPAEGEPRENWRLKSAAELLDLKICDPAMGSGAFLVQVCRYLSERVVEAWTQAESEGQAVTAEGVVVENIAGLEPMRRDAEERSIFARRLVAEQCLYGVDLNPLAVELAKLSIWLVTLAKGRPFGFLDHNLRSGDSLIGITNLQQLHHLSLNPAIKTPKHLFAANAEQAIAATLALRAELRGRAIRDIRDVQFVARADGEARRSIEVVELAADAFIGQALRGDARAATLSVEIDGALTGDPTKNEMLARRARNALGDLYPMRKLATKSVHWPLAFPEVFETGRKGFDAIVGNPPFLGNKFWKPRLGENFQAHAKALLGTAPGKIDLSVVFHRRVVDLLGANGVYGMLATDNIAEGRAVKVGLAKIVERGAIFFCLTKMPWPGAAAVSVSIVCFREGEFRGAKVVNGVSCEFIDARLVGAAPDAWQPQQLADTLFAFAGVDNSKGLAFLVKMGSGWFEDLSQGGSPPLVPYITGEDITTYALGITERWALDIGDRSFEDIKRARPLAAKFLQEVVLPTRTSAALKSYPGLLERWWQFWNNRAALMTRLRHAENFVAFSKVTTYPACMLAPSGWIYTNQVVLVGIRRGDELAICLSSFFRSWLEKYSGGRMRGWLRISISDSIGTFPLPAKAVSAEGIASAKSFNDAAVLWATTHGAGLTEVFAAIHNKARQDPEIWELRLLLQRIDRAVAEAFEFSDLDLAYEFVEYESALAHERHRFQVSDAVRAQIVERLTLLNKIRFAEQSKSKKNTKSKKSLPPTDGLFAPLAAKAAES